ncbi:double-strand break repair protein AddB [Caulobacter mirabilis]|uniref:Double-strand break repair protein AddB n=1 Tax=Caulobacter mirabilis TaxID=69666 RepID=A0A2D2B3H3_9CAUL|nr:double-strand break repair protein AddB [Caulobacter mirabilis]ATQ44764.1 double-strand break repair protein AddB [Caulobacter mirabilis]
MSNPFEHPAPRWFSIPAHRPFLDDLAAGLLAALPEPEGLADAVVLTPTRRGARSLAEAFVAAGDGRAVLLPQIRAIGDLEEGEPPFEPGNLSLDIPPAIDPQRRRYELARLVADHRGFGRDLDAAGALELADALAAFLDGLQIEEVEDAARKLDGLVSLDMAAHWRRSAEVLAIALELWPKRLKALGLIDVADRRVKLLGALRDQWIAHPPEHPLIAAGSTGTAPATARLLDAVARAPKGLVILPGLDEGLADAAWAKVEDQHPQGAMKRLLDQFRLTRADVRAWRPDADSRGRWRRRLINEALRPAEATADWRSVLDGLRREGEAAGVDPLREGLTGLSVVGARQEEEAADVCALLLRETLETPGKTAALITPDLALARRVSARLARFGVLADSSAGAPLAGFPVAVLARLVADWAVDPLSPVLLLAILKHPLAANAIAPEAIAGIERLALRGPRCGDRKALLTRLASRPDLIEAAETLFAALDLALAPFVDGAAPAHEAAYALVETLEALGGQAVWSGPAGEASSALFAGLIADGEGLPPGGPRAFADLVGRLLDGETVRALGTPHPRLRILGALEARLLRADRLILAGLEDGVWPRGAPIDPFLSRPMRKRLDLPSPERRLGLTAHDFAQAACAPEVVLVHSHRREGQPAVESRWLWRLRTLARGAGVELPGRPELLDWARSLDAAGDYAPTPRPAPAPPIEERPDTFAVTRIEALTRDPYSVWARDILKLFPLDRPDEPVESKARGTAIHKAFEDFAAAWTDGEPPAAAELFERLYLKALVDQGLPQSMLARERALAREAARWAADLERRRRADGREVHVERSGTLTIPVQGRAFTLTAKADRIEITPEGLGHVLDFKTGGAPSAKQIDTGFSPQLTLTMAILLAGGFEGLKAYAGDLAYLRVTGRQPPGEEIVRKAAGPESEEAAALAYEGVRKLLALYQDPARGYRSRTAPQFVKTYAGDYDHLARVFEWSTGGEEGGE